MLKHIVLFLALTLGSAFASERIVVGVGVGDRSCGHYESRSVAVLVESPHYDRVLLVSASVEKVVVNGVTTEIVHPARYEDRYCPARYETHFETVWVADSCEPSFRFGLGFFYGRRR